MSERFTETLRTASEAGWLHAVQHRFVNELFAEAVPDAVMARYLIQDHRFLDSFLVLLGAALASADTFAARLRFGRFIGMVSAEENTYFLRAAAAAEKLRSRGVDHAARQSEFSWVRRFPAHGVGPCRPGARRSVPRLLFSAVALELSFFEAAYTTRVLQRTSPPLGRNKRHLTDSRLHQIKRPRRRWPPWRDR